MSRPLAIASAALLLSACAALDTGPRTQPDAAEPDRRATQRQRLLQLTLVEWLQWGALELSIPAGESRPCLWLPAPGPPGGAPDACVRVDDGCGQEQSAALCPRVDEYWLAVPPFRPRHRCEALDRCRVQWPDDGQGTVAATRNGAAGGPAPRTPPWSAAFVSAMHRAAGFSVDEFAFDDGHARYLSAARDGRASAHEVLPLPAPAEPGDLVCAVRGTAEVGAGAAAVQAIEGGHPATPMHCDIVVGLEPGREGQPATLLAVGGNVQQTVARSRITLDAEGRLAAGLNPHVRWVAVMRLRR